MMKDQSMRMMAWGWRETDDGSVVRATTGEALTSEDLVWPRLCDPVLDVLADDLP